MCVHICRGSRCGLGGVEAPDVVFDFARVAAPEAPVRSPSSDATWDLARAFLRGSRCGREPVRSLRSPAPEVAWVSARRAGGGVQM